MADQKVRTRTIPFLTVILEADPDFYAESKQEEEHVYRFSNGEKKKAPNDKGIYEQPA